MSSNSDYDNNNYDYDYDYGDDDYDKKKWHHWKRQSNDYDYGDDYDYDYDKKRHHWKRQSNYGHTHLETNNTKTRNQHQPNRSRMRRRRRRTNQTNVGRAGASTCSDQNHYPSESSYEEVVVEPEPMIARKRTVVVEPEPTIAKKTKVVVEPEPMIAKKTLLLPKPTRSSKLSPPEDNPYIAHGHENEQTQKPQKDQDYDQNLNHTRQNRYGQRLRLPPPIGYGPIAYGHGSETGSNHGFQCQNGDAMMGVPPAPKPTTMAGVPKTLSPYPKLPAAVVRCLPPPPPPKATESAPPASSWPKMDTAQRARVKDLMGLLAVQSKSRPPSLQEQTPDDDQGPGL